MFSAKVYPGGHTSACFFGWNGLNSRFLRRSEDVAVLEFNGATADADASPLQDPGPNYLILRTIHGCWIKCCFSEMGKTTHKVALIVVDVTACESRNRA